jgi:hypothetical protein
MDVVKKLNINLRMGSGVVAKVIILVHINEKNLPYKLKRNGKIPIVYLIQNHIKRNEVI